MPYIPKFNKLSLQEMAYAPQLMRQQHDESVARNMEIAESLKFDYLNQDAARLEPKLQQYSQEIEGVAKDLASSGFSHDTKNKIIGLRSRFTGDEEIRNIKKNYGQAMAGWEEVKKGLIQDKASGQEIANMKKAYFDPEAYKGAYDDDGFYREFTPGMTSSIYDIPEDIKKAMTGVGKDGIIVGNNGSRIDRVDGDPSRGIPDQFIITLSKTGEKISTSNQVEAVAAYMKDQYNPETNSDRGLYAKIMQLNPDDINQMIDQIGVSMSSNYYQSLPGQSQRREVIDGGAGKPPPIAPALPSYNVVDLDKNRYDEVVGDIEAMNTSESKQTMKDFLLGDLAEPSAVKNKQTRIISRMKKNYPKLFNENISERESTKKALQYELAYSGMKQSLYGIKSPKATENVVNSILNQTENATLEKVGKKGDNKIKSMNDLIETYADSKIDWKATPPMVDMYGNLYVRDSEEGLYKINPNTLDEHIKNIQKTLKPIMSEVFDPQLGDKNSNKSYTIPGSNFKLHVNYDTEDPYNITKRQIIMYSGNEESPENIQVLQPAQVAQMLIEGMRSDIQRYSK